MYLEPFYTYKSREAVSSEELVVSDVHVRHPPELLQPRQRSARALGVHLEISGWGEDLATPISVVVSPGSYLRTFHGKLPRTN